MSDAMKTRQILDALRHRHMVAPGNGASKPWVYAEEVRVSTGFSSWPISLYSDETYPTELLGAAEQRIDAYALHTWPSKKGLRIAYEVKASTADLRKELADVDKSAAARFLSNKFWLVVHEDARLLIADVPSEWGVIRFSVKGGLRSVRRATYRDTPLPPYPFMVSVARNLQAASIPETVTEEDSK